MQPTAQGTVQAGTVQKETVRAETVHAETVQKETPPADTQAEGAQGFKREGGKMTHLLPTITMSINFIAATVYLFSGDIPRCIYWICAGMLTLTVTYLM